MMKDVDALGYDDPEERDAAAARLVAAGDAIRPVLEQALASPDSEVAGRAREVMRRWETAKEDARRRFWKEKARAVQLSWDRARIYEFLKQVRPSDPRWPVSPSSAGYSYDGDPMTYYDLHSLDETFNLYVVWNDEHVRNGIRSYEVVGFPDLRGWMEPDLYDSIAALHRVRECDSVLLIRAVNALRPLGKGNAVRALRAYYDLALRLRPADRHKHDVDELRLRPVVELLFASVAGKSSIPDWLRIDLAVECDIPLSVKREPIGRSGPPPDVLAHLEFAASPTSAIRARPLRPTASPLEAINRLIEAGRWEALGVPGERELWEWRGVPGKALGAVYHLFPANSIDPHWDCCHRATAKESWRKIVEQARSLGIAWDPEREDFVAAR